MILHKGEKSAKTKRLPTNSFLRTLWLNAYKRKKMKGKVLYKEPSNTLGASEKIGLHREPRPFKERCLNPVSIAVRS